MTTEGQGSFIAIPQRFFELLQQQEQHSQVMLSLLAEEKKALLEMEMSALLSLSKKKEYQLSVIQNLDDILTEMAKNIALSSGIPVQGLSTLESHLNAPDAEQLAGYRKKLTFLQEEILARNLINKKFAEETKKFLGEAISLITTGGGTQEGHGYTTRGLSRPSKNQPTFINREV